MYFVKKATRCLFSKRKAKGGVERRKLFLFEHGRILILKNKEIVCCCALVKKNLICSVSWLEKQALVLEGMLGIF